MKSEKVEILTKSHATIILEDAIKLNPGKWGMHSYNVAMAAEK